MSEPIAPAAPVVEPQNVTAPEAGQQTEKPAPPWGDDFDPATAWEKIQKANREAANLRERQLTPEKQKQLEEYQALVDASKSEAQRQQEAIEAANRAADTARAEAVRYKAAAMHGIPADHFDLLGSGTEEEITARAEKLSQLLAASNQPTATPPAARPVTRPLEQLRPGATPSGSESEDDAVFAALFGTKTT